VRERERGPGRRGRGERTRVKAWRRNGDEAKESF